MAQLARNRYLTRAGFHAWLLTHYKEYVGSSRVVDECPISLYLEDETKRRWHISALACVPQVDAEPGEDQFHLNHEFRPPRWARDFVHALDRQFGRKPRRLSGEEALYVLKELVV